MLSADVKNANLLLSLAIHGVVFKVNIIEDCLQSKVSKGIIKMKNPGHYAEELSVDILIVSFDVGTDE